MPIEYEGGGDVSNGGKYLDQDGYYHFVITEAREVAQKRDGSVIAGMLCQFECQVLASSVPGQEEKEWSVCIRAPRADMKDGGEFSRKLADRWWLALNAMTRVQIEQKARVSINVEQLRGRQFIAKLKKSEKYMDLDGADVYHVDDPAVKDQPKNVARLAQIRPEFRWTGATKPSTPPVEKVESTGPKADPDNL